MPKILNSWVRGPGRRFDGVLNDSVSDKQELFMYVVDLEAKIVLARSREKVTAFGLYTPLLHARNHDEGFQKYLSGEGIESFAGHSPALG
jgi:hypothetical protein